MHLAGLFTESHWPERPDRLARSHCSTYVQARDSSFKYYISMRWLTSPKQMSTPSRTQPPWSSCIDPGAGLADRERFAHA